MAAQKKSEQAPQFSEDQHAPGYDNQVANDWRRGFGRGGIESAEGKPFFDKSQAKLGKSNGRPKSFPAKGKRNYAPG